MLTCGVQKCVSVFLSVCLGTQRSAVYVSSFVLASPGPLKRLRIVPTPRTSPCADLQVSGCVYVSTHHRAQTCSKCPLSRLRLPSVPSRPVTSALREGPRPDAGRLPTPRLTAQLLRGRPGFRAQVLLGQGGPGRRLFLSSGEGGGRERLMRREVLNFYFLLL